jgi:hypothetical protein
MTADPTERHKLFDLNAVPAKEILRNKARVCPPLSALCEIIDNIFDNFEENGTPHDLSISVLVKTGATPEISIAENSGGIQKAKLEPLVRLGVPHHGVAGSIGTWGEGFKVAAFSLGEDIEVLTSHAGDPPVSVHFQDGWLKSQDWNVPVYSVSDGRLKPGSTVFRIRQIHRAVDWSEIMRQVSVIYGHKILDVETAKRKVRIDFEIDASRVSIKPRPLASFENLKRRLAFPPDFSPRTFTAEWSANGGSPVKCRLVVGLSAHHSGETSGVYMYGNGRLFATALRSRAVGYGESGNSLLRDHPSCWRIHAYAFFEADDGSDIPWQAPLKDGLSETHPITPQFREMFKDVIAPYARFAKLAKASELVPYTEEWQQMAPAQRADVLFGKGATDAIDRFKRLPLALREFTFPENLEALNYQGVACEKALAELDEHAKYVRHVIAKRDSQGSHLQEEVLRILNPQAFAVGRAERRHQRNRNTTTVRVARTSRVMLELRDVHLKRLRAVFDVNDDRKAILSAIAFALRRLEAKGMRRPPKSER